MVKESFFFTFCKRCIAQMRQNLTGILNGDIQLFLQPSQALGRALLYAVFNNNFQFPILKHFADPEGGQI